MNGKVMDKDKAKLEYIFYQEAEDPDGARLDELAQAFSEESGLSYGEALAEMSKRTGAGRKRPKSTEADTEDRIMEKRTEQIIQKNPAMNYSEALAQASAEMKNG
ncbi:MAG: hypothetical protein ACLFUS_12425 [Candidatus Sumerlaeia bacterium]